MLWSKKSIINAVGDGRVSIVPYQEERLRAASYVFSLGTYITINEKEIDITGGYELQPQQLVIGKLQEQLTVGEGVACLLTVRGAMARKGLNALNSDLFVEPGWSGYLTLAITNTSAHPIVIAPGMAIIKGTFFDVQ